MRDENYIAVYGRAMEAVRNAACDDPEKVADANNIVFIELHGTIAGYATVYRTRATGLPVIGLNIKMQSPMYMFGGWHELGHIFWDHVKVNGTCDQPLCDTGFFKDEVDSRTIFREEKEANLLSADVCIKDEAVIDIIGYNTRTQRDYRHLKEYLKKLTCSYEQLRISSRENGASALAKTRMQEIRHRIQETSDSIMELEYDLMYTSCCHSFREMAEHLETTETILRYKLEAMRLREYEIDRQELERYDKIFKHAFS